MKNFKIIYDANKVESEVKKTKEIYEKNEKKRNFICRLKKTLGVLLLVIGAFACITKNDVCTILALVGAIIFFVMFPFFNEEERRKFDTEFISLNSSLSDLEIKYYEAMGRKNVSEIDLNFCNSRTLDIFLYPENIKDKKKVIKSVEYKFKNDVDKIIINLSDRCVYVPFSESLLSTSYRENSDEIDEFMVDAGVLALVDEIIAFAEGYAKELKGSLYETSVRDLLQILFCIMKLSIVEEDRTVGTALGLLGGISKNNLSHYLYKYNTSETCKDFESFLYEFKGRGYMENIVALQYYELYFKLSEEGLDNTTRIAINILTLYACESTKL